MIINRVLSIKGIVFFGARYIGGTKLNADVRWNKHDNPTKSSEPSKHLRSNIDHCFTWAVISNAPKNTKSRNIQTNKRTLKD